MVMLRSTVICIAAAILIFECCNAKRRDNRVLLSKRRGSFSSGISTCPQIYVIRASSGWAVSVRINKLDLAYEEKLSIKQGRSDEEHWYTKRRHKFFETIYNDSKDRRDYGGEVTLPITFDSTSRKVFVTYDCKPDTRSGFKAEWETYPKHQCRIDDLLGDQHNCTGYKFAPVATSCTYNLTCKANYVTYGKAVCERNEWVDSTYCIPDPKLVQKCVFGAGSLVNCSFSLRELSRYYLATDETDIMDNVVVNSHGARSGPTIEVDCGYVCPNTNRSPTFHYCLTFSNGRSRFACFYCLFYSCSPPRMELTT